MATLRQFYLVLSCCLTLLLAAGTVLPGVSRWQCHHTTRLVTAPLAVLPSGMPCRMGKSMPDMACCAPHHAVFGPRSHAPQVIASAPCQPTLTRLASLPAAFLPETSVPRHQSLTLLPVSLFESAALLPPVPTTLLSQQRPPPAIGTPLSPLKYVPGLRAPPPLA